VPPEHRNWTGDNHLYVISQIPSMQPYDLMYDQHLIPYLCWALGRVEWCEWGERHRVAAMTI